MGKMIKQQIVLLMKKHPFLNINGYNKNNGFNWDYQKFLHYRNQLLDKETEIQITKCLQWIDRYSIIPTNKKSKSKYIDDWGSYSLKHIIEEEFNYYISNGACICAFLIKNFKMKKPEYNPIFLVENPEKIIETIGFKNYRNYRI